MTKARKRGQTVSVQPTSQVSTPVGAGALSAAAEQEIAALPSAERAATLEAADRFFGRRPRFEIKTNVNDEGKISMRPGSGGPVTHSFRLRDTFGTRSGDFSGQMLADLAGAVRERGTEIPDEAVLNSGLAAVDAVRPNYEIEAMLAVQMASTHSVAMQMLARANRSGDATAVQNYGSLATKLLRTYTTQIEALAKLRRKGEQTVRVEHVHVYPGGQAIVGSVTTGGGGAQLENGHQAHALSGPAAHSIPPGAPVLREDAERQPVPVAGREREAAVPHARRSPRKRVA